MLRELNYLELTYRRFLDQRRTARPQVEYRDPTDDEWREFHQHFALRKVELGTCARPYGTPCKHEHACFSELMHVRRADVNYWPNKLDRTRHRRQMSAVVLRFY